MTHLYNQNFHLYWKFRQQYVIWQHYLTNFEEQYSENRIYRYYKFANCSHNFKLFQPKVSLLPRIKCSATVLLNCSSQKRNKILMLNINHILFNFKIWLGYLKNHTEVGLLKNFKIRMTNFKGKNKAFNVNLKEQFVSFW